MGLGVLFIGYVLLSVFTLAPTFFVTDLIGSFVIYEALGKLRRHAARFRYAIMADYAVFAVSAVQCVYYAIRYVGIIEGAEIFEWGLEIARLAAMFVLTETVLLALSELASSVGDGKLADKGKRNAWFYVINYVFIIVLSLDLSFLYDFRAAFSAFGLLLRIMCALLNCAFMYSCYMWICLEGDHDMTKPSALDKFFGKLAPSEKKHAPDDPAYMKGEDGADNKKANHKKK